MDSTGFYRGIFVETPHNWVPRIKPLIDFVLDNGGNIKQVKRNYFGLHFNYEPPENFDEDVWDSFFEMVRLMQNRSGNWPKID
jgi:hypothetical protein